MKQCEGHNTPLGCYNDQDPQGCGQYDGKGVYYGLSTASEVFFLIFTTQLYNLCFIMQWFSYLDNREVLQKEYSQRPILPSPQFQWVVNIKCSCCDSHTVTVSVIIVKK